MNAKLASGHAQKKRRVTICKGASGAYALKVTMAMENTFVMVITQLEKYIFFFLVLYNSNYDTKM